MLVHQMKFYIIILTKKRKAQGKALRCKYNSPHGKGKRKPPIGEAMMARFKAKQTKDVPIQPKEEASTPINASIPLKDVEVPTKEKEKLTRSPVIHKETSMPTKEKAKPSRRKQSIGADMKAAFLSQTNEGTSAETTRFIQVFLVFHLSIMPFGNNNT